jgi:hypothetical protein
MYFTKSTFDLLCGLAEFPDFVLDQRRSSRQLYYGAFSSALSTYNMQHQWQTNV